MASGLSNWGECQYLGSQTHCTRYTRSGFKCPNKEILGKAKKSPRFQSPGQYKICKLWHFPVPRTPDDVDSGLKLGTRSAQRPPSGLRMPGLSSPSLFPLVSLFLPCPFFSAASEGTYLSQPRDFLPRSLLAISAGGSSSSVTRESPTRYTNYD